MRHKDEQWEKEIRKGPFASSPFTEDHKRKVLQQVEWMKKSEEGSKGDRPEESSRLSRLFRLQVNNASHKRRPRRGPLVAGTGALVIAAGLFLWIWDDGTLFRLQRVYSIRKGSFSIVQGYGCENQHFGQRYGKPHTRDTKE